jgi:hypothetical protein
MHTVLAIPLIPFVHIPNAASILRKHGRPGSTSSKTKGTTTPRKNLAHPHHHFLILADVDPALRTVVPHVIGTQRFADPPRLDRRLLRCNAAERAIGGLATFPLGKGGNGVVECGVETFPLRTRRVPK